MAVGENQIQKNIVFETTLHNKLTQISNQNNIKFSPLINFIIQNFFERYGDNIEFKIKYELINKPINDIPTKNGKLEITPIEIKRKKDHD